MPDAAAAPGTAPDPDEVAALQFLVWGYKQGEMVSLMVHLGDRLGLYRALDGAGPVTAADLAGRTGLHERWLLEWLRGQAAAGLVDSPDGERFELTPAAAAVLADDEASLAFAAGAFAGPLPPDVVDGLADAFGTGVGLPYDRMGPSGAHRTERMLGPWARLALVPTIIPALDGVAAKLEAGARVLDVGCGAGVALLAMAESYPASQFHGVDLSKHAVDRARAKIAESGLANVTVARGRAEDVAPGDVAEIAGADTGVDLVLTFDCLHDMTRPADAVAAIRRAVAPDGTWLVKDIRSASDWAANRANPMLALLYGFSVASCMSSALSEPGGAGLGTLGFTPEVAEATARAAGFTRFRMHDFDDPANLYYEVRP